jgi:hypothetical protein
MNPMYDLVLPARLYLIFLAFAIWGGYWLQRLAVRHGLRDHEMWKLSQKQARRRAE